MPMPVQLKHGHLEDGKWETYTDRYTSLASDAIILVTDQYVPGGAMQSPTRVGERGVVTG
jgi:hypothetical protein